MLSIKDLLIYFFIRTIGIIVRCMPRKAGLMLGSGLGDLIYFVLKERRDIANNNLRMAFQNTEYDELSFVKGIARESFRNMGKNLIELLCFPKYDIEDLLDMISIEGAENLTKAMDGGKGVIAITAHFGNWELIFHVLTSLTDKLTAVAQAFKNKPLNALVNSYRTIHGGSIIEKKNAARETLRLLRKGFCVIMLADQDAGENGVFVDFFGRPASTARGPIMFALRTGAIVLEIFDIRQPDDTHIIRISKPYNLEISGNADSDIRINTAKLAANLERMIIRYPSQWLWMHNRWKTLKR